MSILPQLERDLDAAARALAERAPSGGRSVRAREGARHGRAWRLPPQRRVRILLLALAGLFAMAAIALAASGVIPIGAPVRSGAKPTANEGVGVPASGGARLLAVRAPDPEGGLPWGLRLVRTTRSELCIQLGRVEDGELGELGIDGAFSDDGSFHPLTSADLPARQTLGTFASSADTVCALADKAADANEPAVRRNAAGQWLGRPGSAPALDRLRDVYYGVLGPHAVSVSYRDGSSSRTVAVEKGTGAYLIVLPASRALLAHAGATWTPYGEMAPSSYGGVVVAITYRIGGKLCERGDEGKIAMERPASPQRAVAHPCPSSHSPPAPALPPRELHRRVNVKLRVRSGVVVAGDVSFVAPFAVTSARQFYEVAIERCGATGVSLESIRAGASIARDVPAGARVSYAWPHPFVACGAKSVTLEVLYEGSAGAREPVIVGSATVMRPAHTHPARR